MSNVLSGARAVFKINNQIIASASNCSYEWRHDVETIKVIDQLEVAEHAEIGVSVSFRCDTFRIANNTVTTMGLMPDLNHLMKQPELVVTVQDKVTGTTLLMLQGVKLISRSGAVNSRGAFTESLEFVGRTAKDEGTLK